MNNQIEALLRDLAWFADRLTNRPYVDFSLRNASGLSLGALLRQQTDEALAGALSSGLCRKAVIEELLVCRYQRPLIGFFRNRGADQETAADLTQEVFVKVCRGELNNYDARRRFIPFLYTIALRMYISSRRGRRPEALVGTPELPGRDVTFEQVAEREILQLLEKKIDNLPPHERKIMSLTIDRCSAEEIATALDVTKSVVYNVRNKVRVLLESVLPIDLAPSKQGRPRKNAAESNPSQEPIQE